MRNSASPARSRGRTGGSRNIHSTEITPEIFEKEIAPARTFVYYEDVKPLMDKGLIKGGSLESAIVIRGESVLEQGAAAVPGRIRAAQDPRYRGRPGAVWPADQGPRHRGQAGPRAEHGTGAGDAETAHEADDAGAAVDRAERGRGARRERPDADPAAPVPVFDGGPHRGVRGRHEMHRREIGHDQRAFFPGPFPGTPGDAGRVAARGDGAGGEHPVAAHGRIRRDKSAIS